MRPKVYISGPISDGGKANADQRLCNVRAAALVAADLISRGFGPMVPQLTEYLERLSGQHFDHSVWMEIDLPWVECADVVLRLPGPSKGSDIEVRHAQEIGIPVVYSVEELEEWRRCEERIDAEPGDAAA